MQTTAVRHEEIHGGKMGVPGGIHEGAGAISIEQLRGFKTRGVPAIVAIPKKNKVPRFEHLKTLYFRVPEDHNPRQDEVFKHLNKEMGEGYTPTVNLEPGRSVKLSLYRPCSSRPTLQDFLSFTEKQGGLLTGPEGLLLSWIEKRDELPTDLWLLSFDGEKNLPKDHDGNPRLLGIFKSSVSLTGTERYLVRLDGPLSNKNCLMVLTYADPEEFFND